MKKYHLLALLVLTTVSLSCARLMPDAEPTSEEIFPTLDPVADALKFEPATLPLAQVGVPYEVEILVTQTKTPAGEIYISEGSLPAGLEFMRVDDQDAALITGVPQKAGTFSFTVYVWCYGTQVSGQTGEMKYEIVVSE